MMLDGWDAIVDYLSQVSGVRRTRWTVLRWSRRKTDPLPILRTPGGRDVVAKSESIESWWDRHRLIY